MRDYAHTPSYFSLPIRRIGANGFPREKAVAWAANCAWVSGNRGSASKRERRVLIPVEHRILARTILPFAAGNNS